MYSTPNWGGSWNTPLNGVHYFRQRINIPESLAGQQAVLRVGTLKDSDATYINGICVGRTSYQYPPRIYQVPTDLLRAGEKRDCHPPCQQCRTSGICKKGMP